MTNFPGGKRWALAVSIDLDADLDFLSTYPGELDRIKSRSVGLYGVLSGYRRLAELFTRLHIPTQWFVAGKVAERFPDVVRYLHDHGFDIGVLAHEKMDFDALSVAEQLAELVAGRDAIERIVGYRANSFRVPRGEWKLELPALAAAAGFAWSSSLPGSETPFVVPGTTLAEVPFRYDLEDRQYLAYNLDPPFPPGQSRITPIEFVCDNWRAEAVGARHYGTLLHLRLNASIIGTPGYTAALARLLGELLAPDDVWLPRFEQLADSAVAGEGAGAASGTHPYALFLQERALAKVGAK